MNWAQAALTAGIALATALAAGWFNKPKIRGEGRKADGEGELAAANARVAEQLATLAATRDEADRAARDRQLAQDAAKECEAQKRQMRADFDAFTDVIEELVPLLPEGESQRKARVAIRAARLAI